MLSTALIVFREILEAALIISIVLAATKAVPKRSWWVSLGVVGGIIGACLVAFFADVISSWASGMGQDVFNASVMFIAVVMLTWHSVWMSKHGREMAHQLNQVADAISSGSRPLTGLAIVVGVAVIREGSEAVLFLYGIAAGESGQLSQMIVGGLLGLAGGIAVGVAMYLGLLQIAAHKLFGVTNVLIMLLAAGMASQGAGFLVSADFLPTLGDTVWDSSWLLSDSSVIGKMLHTLVGYTAQPEGIQIIFYVVTLGAILTLTRISQHSEKSDVSPKHVHKQNA
ncbi:FTR1 family iron permease [Tolumonas lignilytica]|uniref:FTR1 family iron permease n=1 Tax=Tolumonas lignilytica TaxID=1283284 RepID=UPI000463450A|nr:FTR1 family protein [Tolumonas lignilytica]